MIAEMSKAIDITFNTYLLRMFRNYTTNGKRKRSLLLTTLGMSRKNVCPESPTHICVKTDGHLACLIKKYQCRKKLSQSKFFNLKVIA